MTQCKVLHNNALRENAMQDARWAWPLGEASHYTHHYTHHTHIIPTIPTIYTPIYPLYPHYTNQYNHHQAAAYRQNIHWQAFILQSAF